MYLLIVVGAVGFLFALWAPFAASRQALGAIRHPAFIFDGGRFIETTYSVHFVFIEVITVILIKDCPAPPRLAGGRPAPPAWRGGALNFGRIVWCLGAFKEKQGVGAPY